MTNFIHLRNHSEYSLTEGALRIKEMVGLCVERKMPAVAITDSGNLFGIMEFSKACIGAGVQPIIGCEVVVEQAKLVLYAKDNQGFKNLLKIVSQSFLESDSPTEASISFEELEENSEGLMCLTANIDGQIGKFLLEGEKKNAHDYAAKLQNVFGDRLYIELCRHGLEAEQKIEQGLVDIAYELNIPLIATNNCFYADESMFEAHDALLCIAQGKCVVDENRRKLNPEFYFKSARRMEELFADIPEAIQNTIQFAKRCHVKAEPRDPLLPSSPTQEGRSVDEELRHQAMEGLKDKFRNKNLPTARGGDRGGEPTYSRELTEKARNLRQNQTDVEQKLWHELRGHRLENFKFKRQKPVGEYVVDFMCSEKKLIIELDGGQHSEQQGYDIKRTEYLQEQGYQVVRFWNNEVNDNLEGVLTKILEYLKAPSSPPLPPPREREGEQEASLPLTGEIEGRRDIPPEYLERLEYELDIIINMKFPGYFLIVSDFIKWAKSQGIPVGPGRGSGAGSLVAWVLQITDVDPLEFGLLFERFLNPERVSMPDFDIDFCQERREEVIQYVRQKYGNDKVSQIITFGKLQAKAVIRDVARVLQIPYMEADRISKMIPFNPVDPVDLQRAIDMDPELRRLQREDETVGKLLDIGLKLEGLNRHASTHAAGILIADRPLVELIPLYRDPRSDIPVSQYSMKDAETAGLVKFDFLGLRTLTLVDKALKFIEEKNEKIDILDIPLDKPEVFEMLSKGDTVGVFQLDSTLVRDAIRKMRPDKFGDIVALTSLCRPGPMENIPTYNARKHGKETVKYPHDKLTELLSETQGIIVYQEQVMEAARILSGYSLGKADLLRRAMGKKIAAEMDAQREMFSEGAKENGISKNQAKEIFDLIAKFAGYGFNKSHAVAYSLIAYQTAYLRCFYPVEFFSACMNLDIGDTDKLSFYKHEASKQGIEVLPPNVNESFETFRPVQGKISYGLGAIKGVGLEAARMLVEARSKKGAFQDLFDFCRRAGAKVVNKKHLESLAKAGAFDSIHSNRAQIVESAEMLGRYTAAHAKDEASDQISLFGEAVQTEITKPTLPEAEVWNANQRLEGEYAAFGFYLSAHPLDKYKDILEKMKVIPSLDLEDAVVGKSVKIKVAGIVATKKLRSGKKGRFGFAKLSDALGVFEIVMYDEDLITAAQDLLNSAEPLLVSAEAKKDEGGVRIIAERIESLEQAVHRDFDKYVSSKTHEYFVDNEKALEEISSLLTKNPFKQGSFSKAQINLTLTCEDKNVKMKLPEFYAVNDNVHEDLLKIEGVWVG